MDDCKLCGEPVRDDEAVEVESAGMPEQSAVSHEVCWDNYEADFVHGVTLKPRTVSPTASSSAAQVVRPESCADR